MPVRSPSGGPPPWPCASTGPDSRSPPRRRRPARARARRTLTLPPAQARCCAARRPGRLPRAVRRGRRRRRTSIDRDLAAGCWSRSALARRERHRRRSWPARLAAVAADASSTLLEDEPREPWLLNLAGVAALRARRDRRRRGALTAAAPRSIPSCRTSRATSPSARAAAAPAPRRRRACRPPCCAALRDLGAARQARRRRGAPGEGLTLEPVHDRQGRGGDARPRAWPPSPTPSTRSSSSTPARRDRTVEIARGASARASCTTSGRATSPRPATSPSTPRRATGSCTSTPTRSSSTATAERLRALTGQTWREAFFLVETNHTGELEERHRRHPQRAARLPQPPGLPLRGPHPRADRPHAARAACPSASRAPSVRIEHYGYLGAVRDAKEQVAPQHRAARAPGRRGRRHAVPALQPRLGARRRRRHAAALGHFATAWDGLTATTEAHATLGFVPVAGRAGS